MKDDYRLLLKKFAEEILEDIHLYGANKYVIVYIDKATGKINDYSLKNEIVKYRDETRINMSLFELFYNLVYSDCYHDKQFLPPKALIIKTLRQIKLFTTNEFANFVAVSSNQIKQWELLGNITLNEIINIAIKCGVKGEIIDSIVNR